MYTRLPRPELGEIRTSIVIHAPDCGKGNDFTRCTCRPTVTGWGTIKGAEDPANNNTRCNDGNENEV